MVVDPRMAAVCSPATLTIFGLWSCAVLPVVVRLLARTLMDAPESSRNGIVAVMSGQWKERVGSWDVGEVDVRVLISPMYGW